MNENTILNVKGMSCGHCVKAIEENVGKLAGVSGVKVDLESGNVEVNYDRDKVNLIEITNEIEEQGYDVL